MDISSVNVAVNSLQPRTVAPTVSNPLETTGQSASSSTNSSSINSNQPDGLPSRVNDPLSAEAGQRTNNRADAGSTAQSSGNLAQQGGGDSRSNGELDLEELTQIRQLAQRDREVRAHEAAHAAAGGSLTGAPSYSYTTGPDGRRYATSGEVSIESPQGSTPEETIERARTIIDAALAPAEPSPQDLRIAAQARAELIAAQAELERSERQQLEQDSEQAASQPQPANSLATTSSDTESGADSLADTGTNETTSGPNQSVPADLVGQAGSDEELSAAQQREVEQTERAERAEQLREEQQARQERIVQAQQEFAQELAELNRRIQQVQQQLIETGQVDPLSLLQGSLLDTTV